jgi:DNA modification methylase
MKGIMPPIGGVKKANGDNPTYSGNRAPWKFGRIKRTVWTINTKPFKGAHFAVFPEELVREVINAGCPENGIILDPFMGAGTVALVALKMNRNFLGIELKKEYVDMAYKRIDPWLNQEKILQSL